MNGSSSIIGALGGGSGVDMAKLASDLSAARFAPKVQQLTSRSDLLDTRISAAAKLKSQLAQLASAMGDRVRGAGLAPAVTVANTAVATATAAPVARVDGSHSLEVAKLATNQIVASKPYASPDALVGEGTLSIAFGTATPTGFAADQSRAPINIAVASTDTLAQLSSKINASGSGLSAYVATGSAGAQLVVRGATGEANGFVLSGSGASASGTRMAGQIDYLDWNPAADSGQLKQSAGDAAFLFDGVAMTRPANRIDGLPGGLSLTLTGTNSGAPTRVAAAPQTDAIASVMTDLVAALNDVASQLQESAKAIGGELGNDSGARSLKRSLASLASAVVMPNAPPGSPRTLGDLGLSFGRDGSFRLDSQRLTQTLSIDPQGAAAMFTPGLFGVYATLDKFARSAGLSGDPGSLGGSISRYQRQREQVGEQLEKIAERQDALRTQLSKQFTRSDMRVSASQGTLSFLQGQIAAWNRPDG